MSKSDDERLLKKIKEHLNKIVSDTQLGDRDPFDSDIYEHHKFPTKKNVEYLWRDLYNYYRLIEKWSVGGNFMGYSSIPPYILKLARDNGVSHITKETLLSAGGYLDSKWLVFVPYTNSKNSFSSFSGKKLSRNFVKIANDVWLANIELDETIYFRWIYKYFKEHLRVSERKAWRSKISIFHHQLCQIGGGKYTPKTTCDGHYFIFRLNGSINSLSQEYDPSIFFYVFSRGLISSKTIGEKLSDLMTSKYDPLNPEGIIGVGLKDFNSWRFNRNTMYNLNRIIDDEFVQRLAENKFSQLLNGVYSLSEKEPRWQSLKSSTNLMYQFFENENGGGNTDTKDAVSTVLLCSASEAIFRLKGKDIKRSISTYIATILQPKGGSEYEEVCKFLENAYKVRSDFVHKGIVGYVDNEKLFYYIFTTWYKLGQFYLKKSDGMDLSYVAFIESTITKNSKVYKQVFFKDYII